MTTRVTITKPHDIAALLKMDDWLCEHTKGRVEVRKDSTGDAALASFHGDKRRKTIEDHYQSVMNTQSRSVALFAENTPTHFDFNDAREATMFKLTWA